MSNKLTIENNNKRWSDEENKYVIEAKVANLTNREIAKDLGRTTKAVLLRVGFLAKEIQEAKKCYHGSQFAANKTWSKREDKYLLVSAKKGMSLKVIAEKLGRSINATSQRLGDLEKKGKAQSPNPILDSILDSISSPIPDPIQDPIQDPISEIKKPDSRKPDSITLKLGIGILIIFELFHLLEPHLNL